ARRLVAGVDGARDVVRRAPDGRARFAPARLGAARIADFLAIAVQSVGARGVVRRVEALLLCFATRVDRAGQAVVAGERDARQATEHRVTRLGAVTVGAVIAGQIVRDVDALLLGFAARVGRAVDTVVADDGRPRDAAGLLIAVLRVAFLEAVAVD